MNWDEFDALMAQINRLLPPTESDDSVRRDLVMDINMDAPPKLQALQEEWDKWRLGDTP